MAKLTKAEFNEMNKAEAPPEEATEKEKIDMIAEVYNWQQSEGIYGWDEESLQEDLDMSINNFTLAGKNEEGNPMEVEFRRPLDEDVEFEGVACGFRLIRVQGGLYTLQKYRKKHASGGNSPGEPPSDTEESE